LRRDISSGLKSSVTRTAENVGLRIRPENGSSTTKSENAEPQLASSGSPKAFDDSEGLEEVKVGIKASEVKERLESKDAPQTERQRLHPFLQHAEDLKRFKRVQISDFSNDGSFPQFSILNRLHESFIRIEDEL
jgi:hypothetical protein